ncbi:MAG: hypothetical protein J5743_12020 [Victivallales bacterium]|nr:hypothetical protein [Victivallales bacterium]
MVGLRLLGGSSRFAQALTTSCGSLKSMSVASVILQLCVSPYVSRRGKTHIIQNFQKIQNFQNSNPIGD